MESLSPESQQNLGVLPEDLQTELASGVLDLAHASQVSGGDDGEYIEGLDREYIEGLDDEFEISPAQETGVSERVTLQIDNATKAVAEAYSSIKTTNPDESITMTSGEVINLAREKCKQKAIEAQEKHNSEEAITAIQTSIVLSNLYSSALKDNDLEFVQELVGAGLEDELLDAAIGLSGLVNVCPIAVRDLTYGLRPSIELIELATERKVKHMFTDSEPLYLDGDAESNAKIRQDLLDEMTHSELIALAECELKSKNNPVLAGQTAILAVKSIETRESYRIEDSYIGTTLARAHEIILSEESNLDEYNKIMAQLARARVPGQPSYRGNRPLTSELDRAIVELVAIGREDIAARLISGSNHEEEIIKHQLHHTAIDLYPDEHEDIIKTINSIHDVNTTKLTLDLTSIGLDPDKIEYILQNSYYPESALDLTPELWEKILPHIEDPFILKQLCETLTINRDANLLSIMIDGGQIDSSSYQRLLNVAKLRSEDEDQIELVRTALWLDSQIDEQNQRLQQSHDTRRLFLIDKSMSYILCETFTNPKEVFDLFLNIHPNGDDYALKNFCSLFSYGGPAKELTPELSSRVTLLYQKFDGIYDINRLTQYLNQFNLEVLEKLDVEKLQRAIERFKINNEQATYQLSMHLGRYLKNNEFLDAVLAASDDYMALVKERCTEDYIGTYLLDILVANSSDPEEFAQAQKRIIDTMESGLSQFLTENTLETPTKRSILMHILGSENSVVLASNIKTAQEIFGSLISRTSIELISSLTSSDATPEELAELGITKGGQAGIDQLKSVLQKFEESIFEEGELPTEQIIRHPFLRDHLKSITRYNSSQWGSHGDDELMVLLTSSERASTEMDSNYYVADIQIDTKDETARSEFEIPQDAQEEWRAYKVILDRALSIVPTEGPIQWHQFGELLKETQSSIAARTKIMSVGIEKLQAKIIEFETSDKDTSKLANQLSIQQTALTRLSDIDFENVQNLDISKLCLQIGELSSHNSIEKTGLLQTLLVTTALLKAKVEGGNLPAELEGANNHLSLDSMYDMADLIGHITNEETWGELFDQVGGRKQLNTLLSIDALKDAISRSSSIESSGSKAFRFIPTRGPLMELSGHIADSCWASRYESIAEEFPNFTSVVFVQNPESSSRRLAGACMLIETTSANGEPLLVIRGMNPIQNVISQLDHQSFMDEFTEYARSIAEKQGRRLAIVIDGHSGGSATNRPSLYEYLSKTKPNLQIVRLASKEDTTFNGYDITGDTYYL